MTLAKSQGQLRTETAASTQPGACQRTISWFPSLRGCGAPPAGRPQKPRACSHLRTHKTKTTKDGAPGREAQLIGVRSLQGSLQGRAGARGVEERIQTCQASYATLGKSPHLEGPRFPGLSDGASQDGMRPEECERLRASPYPSKPGATSDFNSEASTQHPLEGRAGVLRATLSPTLLSPPPTLCCTLDDPRKVQELDIGPFILEWGREGQGRSPCRKGLPEPRSPTTACTAGAVGNPGVSLRGQAQALSSHRSSPAQTLSRELRSRGEGLSRCYDPTTVGLQ